MTNRPRTSRKNQNPTPSTFGKSSRHSPNGRNAGGGGGEGLHRAKEMFPDLILLGMRPLGMMPLGMMLPGMMLPGMMLPAMERWHGFVS